MTYVADMIVSLWDGIALIVQGDHARGTRS